MKKLLAVALVLIVLSPVVAFAGSSTDAALALGAFAVFNQILSGTGVFGGLLGHQAVVVAPPPPVIYQPAPVVYAPPPPFLRSAAPGSGRATRPGLRSARRVLRAGARLPARAAPIPSRARLVPAWPHEARPLLLGG